MALVFDIGLLAIICLGFARGRKNGFVKTIIMLIGYILAVGAGLSSSRIIANSVYDKFISSKVEKVVYNAVKEVDTSKIVSDIILKQNLGINISKDKVNDIIKSGGDFTKNLAEYAQKKGIAIDESEINLKLNSDTNKEAMQKEIKKHVPEKMVFNVEKLIQDNTEKANLVSVMANPDKKVVSRQLSNMIAKPAIIPIVQIAAFIVTFIVLMIVIRIAVRLINKVISHTPVVGTVNRFLGGILGILKAAVIILILANIIKLVFYAADKNVDIIDQTVLFKHIFNLKLF